MFDAGIPNSLHSGIRYNRVVYIEAIDLIYIDII